MLGGGATGEEAEGCYRGAVREAMAEGVLAEYLRRKCTEVINMFIGEYSYADDLRIHCEEAREQKAIEDAQSFLANGVSVEVVAKSLGMDIATVEELAARATV